MKHAELLHQLIRPVSSRHQGGSPLLFQEIVFHQVKSSGRGIFPAAAGEKSGESGRGDQEENEREKVK